MCTVTRPSTVAVRIPVPNPGGQRLAQPPPVRTGAPNMELGATEANRLHTAAIEKLKAASGDRYPRPFPLSNVLFVCVWGGVRN